MQRLDLNQLFIADEAIELNQNALLCIEKYKSDIIL